MDVKSWSAKRWLVLLFQGVIVLLVLFGKWLGYRINFFFDSVSDSTTLLKVGKSLGKLGEFLSDFQDSGSGGMTALAVVIYLLLIAAVAGAVVTIYSLFSPKSISMAGFAAGAVLFVVLLLLVSITNGSIKKETEGFIEKLFTIGAPAYFTLILSLLGLVVCAKMPDEASAHPSGFPSPKPAGSVAQPAAAERHCPSCGAAIRNVSSQFCTACGAKLDAGTQCPVCGRTLEPGSRFCPDCGADVSSYR